VSYRKWGRVVRWENGVVVRVDEAGEAREEDGVFIAEPIEHSVPLSDEPTLPPEVLRFAHADMERLIVSEGVAVHECDGIRWSERTRRVHVSLARAPLRATLDLADFDLDLVRRIDLRDVRSRAFDRIRLAPHVFASFLPSLIGKIDLEQMPAPHDGRGLPVERRTVAGAPPNVFRPSYRVRPVPAWFNLRAVPFGAIDRDAPEAIARLDDGLLVIDEGRTFRAPLDDIGIKAVGEAERWYPYGAGSFGAEALV